MATPTFTDVNQGAARQPRHSNGTKTRTVARPAQGDNASKPYPGATIAAGRDQVIIEPVRNAHNGKRGFAS